MKLNPTLNLPTVSVSQGCYYKLPRTRWLRKTEIYSLTVLEAKSLQSRYWQNCASSKASQEEFFLPLPPLVVPGNHRHSLVWSCLTSVSTSVFTWPPTLSVWLPLKGHRSLDLGPALIQYEVILI